MIDRDRLRLALDWWDSDFDTQDDGLEIQRIIEAARLVADPDTLVISKVDLRSKLFMLLGGAIHGLEADHTFGELGALADQFTDALLEGQPK